MTQPEGTLVKKIRDMLHSKGAWTMKVHGGEFQETGIPDILACYRGLFIGLEVKLPGEKASPKQEVVMRRIREAGGTAAVVTSVAQAERILKRIARK